MNDAHSLGDPTELAALYAAAHLPPDELAAFESHVAARCGVPSGVAFVVPGHG